MPATKYIFEELLHHYSSRTSEAFASLLSNEKFIQAIERMLVASLEFRDLIQKAVQAAFEQVNLPTREDIEHIGESQRELVERLLSIEQSIAVIETKIDGLSVKSSAGAGKKAVRKKKSHS